MRLYTDGGVIGKNPGKDGGTWAWCLVNEADGVTVEGERSGIVEAGWLGLPAISNNVTELAAVVFGLEALPHGLVPVHWFTDSNVTLLRMTKATCKWNGVPVELKKRALAVRNRIASATLLGGHPSRSELAAGVRKDGFPVSIHNVRCDELCGQQAEAFRAAKEAA